MKQGEYYDLPFHLVIGLFGIPGILPCSLKKLSYSPPVMKSAIHPQMFADAKVTCVTCKAVYLIPSTVKDQQVEVCRGCHPIYTGKKQTEARGGRVERFRKIQAHASAKATARGAAKGKKK